MRTWLWTGVAVLAAGLTAWAGPRLAVDNPIYDFGEVVEGLEVRAVFVLTNTGDAPLHFTRQPTTTCGCTSAPLPKTRLSPGETVELVAMFDTTGFGGRRAEKHVYVYSDDPASEKLTLTVRGYVRDAAPFQGSASTLNYGFYLLVDLRSPAEYAAGHLLGAVNIPFPELENWLGRLPRQRTIYFYDQTGERAAQAAQLLQREGFLAARAIAGGLVGWWQSAGDAFFVWGDGEGQTPSGTPYYGGYAVRAEYVARSFQLVADLRPAAEYAAGHLPGSVNLPLPEAAELIGWADGLPGGGENGELWLWLVDGDGEAACRAAQLLRDHGFSQARCLIGGLAQWRARYGDALLWPTPDGE